MTKNKEDQIPISTNPFIAMDRETRELWERYCDIELAKVRLQQQQLDSENNARAEANLRSDRENEARLLVDNAKAQAEAQKIADASALEQARMELEVRKLRLEGERLENEITLGVVSKGLELLWPKIEQLGAGLAAANRENNMLIREELRLIAGRNPVDGSSKA